MTNISKGRRSSSKLKSMGDHEEYLNRITKSLYYAKLPMTDCLSLPVTELAAEIFSEVKNGHTLERLDVEEASRISRNACVSPCSLILALLYLERLKDCNPDYLQRVAPSELFLVSLLVASKFLNDEGEEDDVFNTEWANSADISVQKINKLEKEFLKAIDWAVFVQDYDFWERLQKLERDIAYKEGQKRGWFSYTELNSLMNSVQLLAVANAVINVSSICLATYAAGIVTLLGSALVTSHLPGSALSPRSAPSNTSTTELVSVEHPHILANSFISEEILLSDEENDLFKCNETCKALSMEENDEQTNVDSQRWLTSVMAWLPENSLLESETRQNFENIKLENTGTLTADNKFLFDTNTLLYEKDNFNIDINWKEVLGLDVQFSLRNWRQYTNYIIKCL